jgi:hypothetical protein
MYHHMVELAGSPLTLRSVLATAHAQCGAPIGAFGITYCDHFNHLITVTSEQSLQEAQHNCQEPELVTNTDLFVSLLPAMRSL